MTKNNLIQHLDKKYGFANTKKIMQKFSSQKQKYVEQGKK